jgi:hypothetical protein
MHRATGPTIGLHPRETFEIKDSVTCAKIPWDEKNTPKKSNQGLQFDNEFNMMIS